MRLYIFEVVFVKKNLIFKKFFYVVLLIKMRESYKILVVS